jgi:hypothetical protein
MMNNEQISFYKKHRKQDALELALKNTELPIVHINKNSLTLSYSDIENMNNLLGRVKKTALLHQKPETLTPKLSQLILRLNNQHAIIDANYQDIEVASSFAETCQLLVLNSYTSRHISEALEGNISAVVGYVILRDERDLNSY